MSYTDSITNMLRGTTTRSSKRAKERRYTSLDAIEYPTVEKLPMYYGDKQPIDSHVALVNTQTGKVISVASKQYSIIDHKDIVEQAYDAVCKAGIRNPEVECRMIGDGDRMWLRFMDKERPVFTENGEEIYPTFIFKNSYDLGWRASVVGGVFRQICSNGAYIGTASGYSRRHVGSAESDMFLAVQQATETVQSATGLFSEMSHKKLPKGQRIDINSLRLTAKEKNLLMIMRELSSGVYVNMIEDDDKEVWSLGQDSTVFSVYNLLTEFTTHHVESTVRRDTLSIATNRIVDKLRVAN